MSNIITMQYITKHYKINQERVCKFPQQKRSEILLHIFNYFPPFPLCIEPELYLRKCATLCLPANRIEK